MTNGTTKHPAQAPNRILILWNRAQVEEATTSEHAVSSIPSPEDASREHEIAALADCLGRRGHEVHPVDIEDDCERIKDAVVVIQPSLVLNLVGQVYGEAVLHAAVAGYLELLDVPYVGSDPVCLATCQERVVAHVVLREAGVAVPGFAVIRDIDAIPETSRLRFPLIVTQAYDDVYEEEGRNNPIHDRAGLVARSTALFEDYDLPFLIEEFVGGRRLYALVLGNRELEMLPLVEIDDDGAWALPILDQGILEQVHEMARRAFRALGCRDMAQVDIHLSSDDQLYVVDVRAFLDMGPESALWAAAGHVAGGREDALARIVEVARERVGAGVRHDPAAGD